jgi:hypothetical protein
MFSFKFCSIFEKWNELVLEILFFFMAGLLFSLLLYLDALLTLGVLISLCQIKSGTR